MLENIVVSHSRSKQVRSSKIDSKTGQPYVHQETITVQATAKTAAEVGEVYDQLKQIAFKTEIDGFKAAKMKRENYGSNNNSGDW